MDIDAFVSFLKTVPGNAGKGFFVGTAPPFIIISVIIGILGLLLPRLEKSVSVTSEINFYRNRILNLPEGAPPCKARKIDQDLLFGICLVILIIGLLIGFFRLFVFPFDFFVDFVYFIFDGAVISILVLSSCIIIFLEQFFSKKLIEDAIFVKSFVSKSGTVSEREKGNAIVLGQVFLNGAPQTNHEVRCVSEGKKVLIGQNSTDANGKYFFVIPGDYCGRNICIIDATIPPPQNQTAFFICNSGDIRVVDMDFNQSPEIVG